MAELVAFACVAVSKVAAITAASAIAAADSVQAALQPSRGSATDSLRGKMGKASSAAAGTACRVACWLAAPK